MAANSLPPSMPPSSMPPQQGGNGKLIAIVILLLLGVAGLAFVLLKKSPPPEPIANVVPPVAPTPITPTAADDIEIPDELPDMSVPPDLGGPRCPEGTVVRGDHCVRYVEVGGGGGGPNWNCSGNIDAGRIRASIAEHSGEVRTCYERRLKANNTLSGSVNIMVKIGASGNVAATQVSGSLRDNEVFSCIRNMAERWHFPAPEGGSCAVARIPYNLTPNR